ncbi:MAG: ExeM/NucH family extracellular endonuclease [Oxalobacteraceae bacterium]|nr:ExeM/NucH family extracellular endonuclease [Oxalobacteraceae bacterium]
MRLLSCSSAVLLALSALVAGCGGGNAGTSLPSNQLSASTMMVNGAGPGAMPSCPAPANPLQSVNAVQGAGKLSPLAGQQVSVRGVVTGDFQAASQLNGFFIQQPVPDQDGKTSEGIFVYAPASATPVKAGQYVQVSGTVEEFKSGSTDPERATQISQLSRVDLCGSGPVIKARKLALPVASLDELEALEGMLVEVTAPLTVTDTYTLGRYGELRLSANGRLYQQNNHPVLTDRAAIADLNARSQILLDDGAAISNPTPIPYLSASDNSGTRRVGDTVTNVRGVLTWGFDAWRIEPTQAPTFTPANPRTAAPAAVGGSLRAGSLNVLNYFTTLNQRGANSSAELKRQRDKLVSTIVALDADVLGLMEIENTATVSLADLVAAVNAKTGASTYALVNSGTPGTDAIKVAMIYKPARVSLIGQPQVPADPDFGVDGGLRPPVAQRFAAIDNNGSFWFVVNHLKSKGSCPSSASSVDRDDGQGCWNVSRVRQASALNKWVGQLVANSGEADVLMVGDFNAYLHEDPIKTIEAAGFEDLLKRLPASDRYTYVFNGESGALDHGLASSKLSAQVTGVTVWHINADEPIALDYNTEFKTDDRYAVTPYRSSDHDPVLVGLNLTADAAIIEPVLSATLPTVGQAGIATTVNDINAVLSKGATSGTLSINHGDGSATQVLALNATTASFTYASAGTFALRLQLDDSNGKRVAIDGQVVVSAALAPSTGSDVFFSEYVEGSGNNKAIELFNPTAAAVDLTLYRIKLFSNGAGSASQTLPLTGSLAAGATLVVHHGAFANPAAIAGTKIASSSIANFNGDDALTLEKNGSVIDAIGQVGFDPGSEWVAGTASTLNRTLRRKSGITGGSIPPNAPAFWDIALEWDAFASDTFDGLGRR